MAQTPDVVQSQLRSAWKLYTLPQTLVEILKVTGSEDYGTLDLTRVVLRDPPLTAKLLKLANSAIYGQARKVSTVNQAVVLLGFRAVKSLALSTSVYDMFSTQSGFTPEELKRFWRHCLETATFAQLFAARVTYPVQEEAFVAGLLHDLGIVILSNAFRDEYRRILVASTGHKELIEAEDAKLGINHADAASYLFVEWGLPEALVDAVRYHHRPLDPGGKGRADKLTLLVALADRLGRHSLEPNPPADGGRVEEKYGLTTQLGLTPDVVREVDAWVSANLSTIAAYLDMDIGSPLEVLAEANNRLFDLFLDVEALLLQRHDAIRQEVENERGKIAAEVLRVVSATFSHYINNATTTIMGHAQLIEMALQRGQLADHDGRLAAAMKTIQNSVINISAVLDELKATPVYQVVDYHERSKILDVDTKIRQRIAEMLGSHGSDCQHAALP